jgi:hypothetical protein
MRGAFLAVIRERERRKSWNSGNILSGTYDLQVCQNTDVIRNAYFMLLYGKYEIESTILYDFIDKGVKTGKYLELEDPIPGKHELRL